MKSVWLALLILGGCGASTTKQEVSNHGRRVRLVCDAATIQRLTPIIAARFGVTDLELRCIAGEFGAPGYFIEAIAGPLRRVGIVDPSGAELIGFRDEPTVASSYVTSFWTADLDGDGQDEIIESWRGRGACNPIAGSSCAWCRTASSGASKARTSAATIPSSAVVPRRGSSAPA
jgi:hypothetical protein